MKGFFNRTQQRDAIPVIPRCGACGLQRGCESPKMPVTGRGAKGVLVVAEAPGRDEDAQGTQLIGSSGQLLRKELRRIGIDLDEDCWKTNAVICWPGEGNPTPNDNRIEFCRPNLLKTIRELRPSMILLLGGVAVKSLISHLWKEGVGGIGRWAGWKIPCRWLDAWICPTFHPAYLARTKDPALQVWFRRHLKAAFEVEGEYGRRPYGEGIAVTDTEYYSKRVRVEKDVLLAADLVRSLTDDEGDCIAFDYETTMLKPDGTGAEIVSCSIAWYISDVGVWSLSYPWHGETIQATSELLRSKVKKISWNIKFEERWTRAILGHGVRNWVWDGMQASHVLDNRPGISSLKFQSFVQLGQESYDDHIKPYLKAKGQGKPNRIRELDLDELLLYGGMDSLLTYEIALKQSKEMGIEL